MLAFGTSWGPNLDIDGAARFRIWAPASDRISVRTIRGDVALERMEGGWFETRVTDLPPDSAYAFLLPDGRTVPDPAARAQVEDVHGPSRLVDPRAHSWRSVDWRGRPWHEAVIYELHVGTFTEAGTFAAAAERLDHLVSLGVTMVELMPVAQFAGDRGWGYDGVLLYAPHRRYGGPEGLKMFVDAAHERGLMVILDVVYNHFGPDGNYLHLYAPDFFDAGRKTPWGAAIAYEKPPVRRYFIENALYWLEEYRLDGFRFDAIDQIRDRCETHILEEIALEVRERFTGRPVHLTTEDNRNVVHLHARDRNQCVRLFTGEWNDDFHNVAHVLATGESEGYYVDFVDEPERKLGRALTDGYIFQGEHSTYLGRARGKPATGLPPLAFIDFLQNHDQIGNRALGERLNRLAPRAMVEALTAITILSPSVPLLFMGEEWGETNPFLYFTDFHGELAAAVREGRRREFSAWAAFRDPRARAGIPDPNAPETMSASRIDWSRTEQPDGRSWLAFHRSLIAIRARDVAPRLPAVPGGRATLRHAGDGVVAVTWSLDGARLHLDANLASAQRPAQPPPPGRVLFAWPGDWAEACAREQPDSPRTLPALSVVFRFEPDRWEWSAA